MKGKLKMEIPVYNVSLSNSTIRSSTEAFHGTRCWGQVGLEVSDSPPYVAIHGLVRSNRITEVWLTSRRWAISR